MFISLEGPEGAGKSTVIAAIASRMMAEIGVAPTLTREPGSGEFGAKVRALLLDGDAIPAEAELFLFLADRANHVRNVVRPALEAGGTVLCDRYGDSTVVYQSLVRGLDRHFVESANRLATGGLVPDVTLLLDLDPRIGLARVKNPDRLDREPLEFHDRVRGGFLRLAAEDPRRWIVIDASQSIEVVSEVAWNGIAGRLDTHNQTNR